MASDSVHPLRISKGTPGSSPNKMASGVPRPLSEIGPTEKRRNSPSWNMTNTSPKKSLLNQDSSPFQSSPLESSVTSPRLFWQSRNTENVPFGRSGSPSPTRRSSIERLQRASRVKNSNILALEQKQEYDPTRIPQIERPLAKVQDGSFRSSLALSSPDLGLFRSDSKSSQTTMSPARTLPLKSTEPGATIPTKEQPSPTKSSLSPSKFKHAFEQESGLWSAESSFNECELPIGRSLHRHAKSVTFDAAPPQINEYEMATPDISTISTNSREDSYESAGDEDDEEESGLYDPSQIDIHEDSFDASLEDTNKTPVVGPEDWREDLAGGQYVPTPSKGNARHSTVQRTDSTTSDHRPLPALPGGGLSRSHSNTSNRASPGLNSAAERMLGSHRSLPSPPPAFTSKLDMQNIGNSKMPLEERLKLMLSSDDNDAKSAAEVQRERRLRRGAARERSGSPEAMTARASAEEVNEMDDTLGDISALNDYQLPPRISRESIMRRVHGNKAHERESGYNFSSPPASSPARSPERQLPLDPDVPIPSTEDTIIEDVGKMPEVVIRQEVVETKVVETELTQEVLEEEEEGGSVIITRNPEDEEEYDEVSEMYDHSILDTYETDGSRRESGNDTGSHYSETPVRDDAQPAVAVTEAVTPRVSTPVHAERKSSLPQFEAPSRPSDFSKSFDPFMASTTNELKNAPVLQPPSMFGAIETLVRPATPEASLAKPDYDGSGWGEPEEVFDDEPGTPDSVIHHTASEDEDEASTQSTAVEEPVKEAPVIPERIATVKAPGAKLKTRVSATPTDLAAMREARRQVSHEIPDVPPIPQKHQNRLSRDLRPEQASTGDEFLERHPSFKNRSLTLDLDLGFGMDQDFERVIEAQKRGYLMRQNTKLVAASDKDGDPASKIRSAGNSPVKQDRPQSWVVEPWSGKGRQSGQRQHVESGGVPPMPGHQSNAQALTQVEEENSVCALESGERGRLFVKVMGVKDLDLPMPKNERTWFSLTLDNGVHCVTTAWLEMARNAPIGQEFELVVPNDLEFQLTLNVKLEKPAPIRITPSAKASKPKASAFSRVFASPKKRKEMDMRQREEEERAAQQTRQRNGAPSAYELLSPLVASDGSFGRSYVCLKEHEHRCYGRPYMAEVSCFNEWATGEETGFPASMKSKRGTPTVGRRAPYRIGKLELQLLFVPRPKNATDEDMPKSMNSCIRELKATEERLSRNWEGHLSQQGGDCPYWRRRYFKLAGTKLTAYHEATRQPRATINLSNAKRLIDDRRSLTEKETMGRGGLRRRSAFAEEEEGYMFVEEGFRIRFNNGEVIDFYADTSEDKEGWMKALADVIGRDGDAGADGAEGGRLRSKWCELVLKREEQLRRRAENRRSQSSHPKTKSMYL